LVKTRDASWQRTFVASSFAKLEGRIRDRIAKIDHALTVKELTKILNLRRAFIYRLAASGQIPSMRVGNAVRFDPKCVTAWLRKDLSN
jgi:excisionase family DNA binding protein